MIIQTSTSNVIENLTYTEMDSIRALARALDGKKEKVVVASAIADTIQTTRSAFVAGVRKLEIVGVIRAQSMGQKGLRVEVLNPEALAVIVKG